MTDALRTSNEDSLGVEPADDDLCGLVQQAGPGRRPPTIRRREQLRRIESTVLMEF